MTIAGRELKGEIIGQGSWVRVMASKDSKAAGLTSILDIGQFVF